MPEASISIQAAAQTVQVQVQGLHGLAGSRIELASANGQWMLALPRAAFPSLITNPGDTLILTLGLVRVGVEGVDEEEQRGPKLILPGRH